MAPNENSYRVYHHYQSIKQTRIVQMTQKIMIQGIATEAKLEPETPVTPDLRVTKSSDSLTCLTIKTGNPDCLAHFYPALYQLTLVRNDHEEKVELGFSGSRLLERLARNPGEVVSREDLLSHAWSDRVVGQGSLNQQIYTLRQILCDEKEREIIQTLPRRGYQLNPQCVEIAVVVTPPILIQPETQPQVGELSPAEAAGAEGSGLDSFGLASSDFRASSPILTQPSATQVNEQPATTASSLPRWWIPTVGTAVVMLASSFMLLNNSKTVTQDTPTQAHTADTATELETYTQGKAVRQTKLYYASLKPEELSELQLAGDHLMKLFHTHDRKPTQVFISLHDNTLDVTCLGTEGRANAIHFPQEKILSITSDELRECLP